MSELIKIKQIDQLTQTLAAKALDSDVVKKANNLSDVTAATARTNLSLYSKAEVDAMILGAKDAYNVADLTARAALTGLKVTDRVFVNDDGDSKWALYIVTAVTTGTGSTSTFKKVADEDLFTNALTAAAIKAAYESNSDTYAFSGAYKTKLDRITVSANVNLDTIKSTADSALANAAISQSAANTASTTATAAQNTANTASTTATAAQTAANNALAIANDANNLAATKQDAFNKYTETFTGLTAADNSNIQVTLTKITKAGMEVLVFFNGVRVKAVTNTAGTNIVTFRVPYITEAADDIMITYAG